ncbi:NAD(P)H-hydrate dehydratase [Psychrobacter sp. HD31]|uniref:NAD(P)H-hydrate dehydratase n=1 Tax=Psychrobacter sp. HD31 TaxID=3112003 RepID=UPI003DA667BC
MNNTLLYTSQQIYQIEQDWFKAGNPSFGLMQQASWQMAIWINKNISYKNACIWTGSGNNGGDGWLLAHYLCQFGWQVTVVEVAEPTTEDSKHAKQIALKARCQTIKWHKEMMKESAVFSANVHIDALFGIGLDREPMGDYATAIAQVNQLTSLPDKTAIAVDIPSGLVSSTGQVFNGVAICADITLCLLASKLGLFIKDGKDYAGQVVTLPLIPLPTSSKIKPTAIRLMQAYPILSRLSNSHKGSFGHVLVVGGNKTEFANGMGGASILAATGAFAVGAGKVSVACHADYHNAVLASKPNAMVVDLHNPKALEPLFAQTDVVAIGMGLGREQQVQSLFVKSVEYAMQANCKLVIDADGLYHLASLKLESNELVEKIKIYAANQFVAFTPHTGEMARLLGISNKQIEDNRTAAVDQAVAQFGGHWLLKGAGSMVYEDAQMYVCDVGNAGMATAGMGDVLAGILAGLQAQHHLTSTQKSLRQAVLIHGQAGDALAKKVGAYGMQTDYMEIEIIKIMADLSAI